MQLPHAPTVPIEVVRELFSAMSGETTVDFDEADFAALPPHCEIRASFGISRGQDDIDHAVETAWPYPVGTQQIDALVAVRANGMDIVRVREIQRQLHRKMHDNSSLFISFGNSNKLPHGMVFITALAITHLDVSVATLANGPFSPHHSGD